MKTLILKYFVPFIVVCAAGPVLAGDEMKQISGWPEKQKKTAEQMIQKYGQPSGITASRLIWSDLDAPWEEMVIFREAVNHDFPMPHQDYLEQAVYYDVPADKIDELAAFDGSVIVYRTEGRMAARCDKEAANFLALNLAHDLITGEKDVEQARDEYAQAVQQMLSANTPQIMTALKFEPMSASRALSSDVAVIEMP